MSSQDFVENIFYYGVNITDKLYLVSSESNCVPANDQLDIELKNKQISYSNFSAAGLTRYLSGDKIDLNELFNTINEYIEKYIYFTDKRMPRLITIWIMATYVYRIFDNFGYLWITGEKQSGKTELIDIIQPIAFNGISTVSISVSSLFRIIENDGVTLLIDEFERMSKYDKEKYGELMSILNSGYKKNATVIRSEKYKNSFKPTMYSTYSPKLFSGINKIDDVLNDRSIKIKLLKKPASVNLPRRRLRELQPRLSGIRDNLYIFGLTYAKELLEILNNFETLIPVPAFINNRELDIWESLLSIAYLINHQSDNSKLMTYMIEFAELCYKEKIDYNLTENETIKLLKVLNAYRSENEADILEEKLSYYIANKLFEFFKDSEEYSWMEKRNSLTKLLREKLEIRIKQIRHKGDREFYYIVDNTKMDNYFESYKEQIFD